MVAGAGNETTGRLIGRFGALMAQYPEARRELAADPSLVPGAVEEILRFEPVGPFTARHITLVTVTVTVCGTVAGPRAVSTTDQQGRAYSGERRVRGLGARWCLPLQLDQHSCTVL